MEEIFFAKNRENVFHEMTDQSVLVLFAGQAPVKRGDELYPFSPDRNFFYATGIDCEKCILLLAKYNNIQKSILFIERENGPLAKWVGANMTAEEAAKRSKILDIKYIDEFESEISVFLFKYNIEKCYLDLEKRQWDRGLSPALLFAAQIREKYAGVSIKNCYTMFGSLREIKKEYEIIRIKKAIDITCKAMECMMKNARPGMMEYEIEAYFDFILKKNGVCQKAFQTIAASGKNATILHYADNNSKTKKGDLILFDVGAQVGWYNGDITRTFPVDGKFSEKQKLIYNIVLEGQKRVIESIKPGLPFVRLNEILIEYYFEALKEIGLVKSKQEVSNYYYHGVSHYLGAETHDIGRYTEKELKPGMVLTVEPGLYIEKWEIGIRIEDDVLVTETGCDVLSKNMIKTVEEIESFMAGE